MDHISPKSTLELPFDLIASAMQHCAAAILITDVKASIKYANNQFYELTGYLPEEVIDKNPNLLKSGNTDPDVYRQMWSQLRQGKAWYGELINRKKNGTLFIEKAQISPFSYEDDTYYIAVKRDITLEKNMTEKLSDLAYFDALTRLPNRTSFFDHLQSFLIDPSQSTDCYSLLLIDLNEFKSINDSKGHDYGDLFLQTVARRFKNVIDDEGIVARLGGDEFVVLLPNCDANVASVLAQRLIEAIAYIEIGNKYERGSAAIGITTNTSRTIPSSLLLKQADLAMYRAKQCQANWLCYTDQMGELWGRKKALAKRLSAAIEQHRLEVGFIPVVDLANHSVVSYKSRLDWQDQVFGLVDRFEFIPIAEESQLIRKLNLFTIEQACKYASVGALKTVAVKVSSKNFGHGGFVDEVVQILRRYHLPGHCLILEVFEEMLSKKRSIDELYQLVDYGCQITVADFGMGHISISDLRDLPIQKIKISALLTQEIAGDESVKQVAKAIVGLANLLDIETIAEGVENEKQWASLSAIGCHFASGSYVSRLVQHDA
ncbi:putative bifunctional diguanylate cyclase/phosphodiesterase [Vibrio sp. 10N.286.49.B1]|uniref:putative bifunctional diguanylate cyclase/phosphodiesterase n=1 Tax=unclassified Vibrio TaxID=2614977 RepID=UPI0010569161|nr:MULTISPECIES: EAL domain-containing protein [unclassified Vibrio]